MKRVLLSATVAIAALTISPAAYADTITLTPTPTGEAGFFGGVTTTPGAFTRTFTFTLSQSGTISSGLITAGHNAATRIDFVSAFLNGQPFSIGNFTIPGAGNFGFGFLLNTPVAPGLQTLVVNGISGGGGAFAGSVAFTAAAVPEPATWAMMIFGFGMVGYALRRRRKLDWSIRALAPA